MSKYNVHRVRFCQYLPQTINCIAFDELKNRIALSRADHSIEIWSVDDNWFQEKIIRNNESSSIEGLVWAEGRLFSAGLCCDVTEYDLYTLRVKQSTPSYSGAVWCLACNSLRTRLAAGTEEGCITLFDIEAGALRFLRSFDKQEGRILCLAWHPDDDCIVSGGIDNIRIWSCHSGRARQRLMLQRQHRQKEVLVWCVAVTRDMTIVSGDSCGRTIFWNGKQGSQIKCISSHRADVQTMCVNQEGTRVFTSGVDPVIIQFDLVPVSENSDFRHWVRSVAKSSATHDIRALALTKTHLVAGGVDAHLAHAQLTAQGTSAVKKIHPVPQASLVRVSSRGLLLFQFKQHLELWKLGSTDSKSDIPGTVLPLSGKPVKLAVVKAKDEEMIVCCGLSDDGQWLAYSDTDGVRLFQLEMDFEDLFKPRVSLHRVRYRPPDVLPALTLTFSLDGSTLVLGAVDGSVQVLKVDAVQPSLTCTFPPIREPAEACYLLSLSGDSSVLCVADYQYDIHIYCLRQIKLMGCLPRVKARAAALHLNHDGTRLLVAYSDRKVLEYDVHSRQFTDWTRRTMDQWPSSWLNGQSAIRNVQYNPVNHEQIFVQDVTSFAMVDKSLPFQLEGKKEGNQKHKKNRRKDKTKTDAIRTCDRYKLLLHAEVMADEWLVVVERPEVTLSQALPEALQRKKFGT